MRFIDGFDHYNYSPTAKKKWDDGSGYASFFPGRFGVGNLVRPASSGNSFVVTWVGMTKTIAPSGTDKIICGAALRFDANAPDGAASGRPFLAIRGTDGKHQIQFFMEPGTGRIRVGLAHVDWPKGRGPDADLTGLEPAWYTDSDFVPPLGLWFYFEVVVDITGNLDVYVDSVPILTLSGLTTILPDVTGYTGVRWMGMTQFNTGYDLDDLYIADGTGSHVTDAIGEVRIEWRTPNAEGDTTDWIPSVGTNNALNVDGVTQFGEISEGFNGPIQYNRTETVGATDLYHHEDFTRDGTVYAIQVNLAARKDDVGNRKVKSLLRTGGTTFEGDEVKLYSDYVYVGQIWPQNPDTEADWTRTEVNAAQTGIIVSV